MMVIPGRSGIPEDRYITTWAFTTPNGIPVTEDHLAEANTRVTGFYAGMSDGAVTSIANQLGAPLNLPEAEIRSYNLGQATLPRQPFITKANLGTISDNLPLPSEVALCASFYSGRNLPRRRGRVYVGPFQGGASEKDPNTGAARPKAIVIQALLTSMQRLERGIPGGVLRWAVLSQADADLKNITAGWVDNAWDTQRRRGEAPTARTVWSSIV